MSNRQQDNSVQFIEKKTESRVGTETCTLVVTILESREREKCSNDLESSLSETETEAGTEVDIEAETAAFSCVGTVFSVKRTGDFSFLWEGGCCTVFNSITGTDRLCDEGPGQDDEG
jgi:hypothetical protein